MNYAASIVRNFQKLNQIQATGGQDCFLNSSSLLLSNVDIMKTNDRRVVSVKLTPIFKFILST